MNRRKLLSMCGQSAIGLMAAPLAIKAAVSPEKQVIEMRVTLRNSKIIKAVVDDYRANGKIRQEIKRDIERGI